MDIDAFKQHYLPLHPKLYRVAFTLVGNREDAEDLLQETYAKLWSRREELDQVNHPEAFAVTLLKNSCLDFLRAAQRHGTEDEDLFDRYEMAASPSPQQRLEEQEQVQQVKRIIRRLPAAQRQVICLRGLQDYSLEEIGELTGFSAANVRTLLSRARKTIREQFQKWYAI